MKAQKDVKIVRGEKGYDADSRVDKGLSIALGLAYGTPNDEGDARLDLDKVCEEAKRRREISKRRRTYFFYASAACAACMAVIGIVRSVKERADFKSVIEESLSFEYERAEEEIEYVIDINPEGFVPFLYEETGYTEGDFQSATEEYVADLYENKGVYSP